MTAAAQRAEEPAAETSLPAFSPDLMKRLDPLMGQLIAPRRDHGDHDLEVEDAEEDDPPEDHDGV